MSPQSKTPQLKKPDMYEELRDDGMSKQKAARISNAAAKEGASKIGRRGGKAGSYDDWTVPELRNKAKDIGLHGYSKWKKAKLIDELRNS